MKSRLTIPKGTPIWIDGIRVITNDNIIVKTKHAEGVAIPDSPPPLNLWCDHTKPRFAGVLTCDFPAGHAGLHFDSASLENWDD